jgi:hypothetical protein
MSASPTPTPIATFRRCSAILGHWFASPAQVTITQGRVECGGRWFRLANGAALVHERPVVFMVRSRTMPWPWDASFELIGETGQKVYIRPVYHDQGFRRMIAALEQAGFLLRERKVWLLPFY